MTTIHIVIVNFRSADFAIGCLESLASERASGVSLRVTVVDSASGDDSVQLLETAIAERDWGDFAELLPLETNAGFAAGNNAGIAAGENWPTPPRYTLLLNPDTKIRPGAVSRLAEFMDQHPEVGIVGSRLEWEDGRGQRAARRFPTVASEFESTIRFGPVSRLLSRRTIAPPDPEQATETEWVVGAAMMIRRDVFGQIGMMDEDYFLYFEEVDYCLQARRAGWEIWYLPESRVVHYVGSSTGVTSSQKRGRCPAYWFESRRRFFLKNHGRLTLWLANVASVVGLSLFRLKQVLMRRPNADHAGFLADFVRYNFIRTNATQRS